MIRGQCAWPIKFTFRTTPKILCVYKNDFKPMQLQRHMDFMAVFTREISIIHQFNHRCYAQFVISYTNKSFINILSIPIINMNLAEISRSSIRGDVEDFV